MARKQREIECVVTFTEGCEQRFTKAMLDIYDEAMEQTEKLIALLVTANSLADELAVTLSDLKLDVKI